MSPRTGLTPDFFNRPTLSVWLIPTERKAAKWKSSARRRSAIWYRLTSCRAPLPSIERYASCLEHGAACFFGATSPFVYPRRTRRAYAPPACIMPCSNLALTRPHASHAYTQPHMGVRVAHKVCLALGLAGQHLSLVLATCARVPVVWGSVRCLGCRRAVAPPRAGASGGSCSAEPQRRVLRLFVCCICM